MKWHEVNEHCSVSECGYYTVTKSPLMSGEPVYLAFYRIGAVSSSKSGKASDLFGRYSSFKTASQRCTDHERQLKTRPVAA